MEHANLLNEVLIIVQLSPGMNDHVTDMMTNIMIIFESF
jgi:hypothetical protein